MSTNTSTDALDPLADRLDNLVADEGLAAALAVVLDAAGSPVVTLRFADDLAADDLDRIAAAIRVRATLATR